MRLKLSKGTNRRGKGKEGKEKRRCEKGHAQLTICVYNSLKKHKYVTETANRYFKKLFTCLR